MKRNKLQLTSNQWLKSKHTIEPICKRPNLRQKDSHARFFFFNGQHIFMFKHEVAVWCSGYVAAWDAMHASHMPVNGFVTRRSPPPHFLLAHCLGSSRVPASQVEDWNRLPDSSFQLGPSQLSWVLGVLISRWKCPLHSLQHTALHTNVKQILK